MIGRDFLLFLLLLLLLSSLENPDELSFKSGELIMLKAHYGEDWYRGKLISGEQGIFPKNFVEVVVSWVLKYGRE